jgi:hypothetical protein
MSKALADQLHTAKVYDLEQPCFAGMPVYPTHKQGVCAFNGRHQALLTPAPAGALASR